MNRLPKNSKASQMRIASIGKQQPKLFLVSPLAIIVLLFFSLHPISAGESRLTVANVTGSGFSISWVTDAPSSSRLKLYKGTRYLRECHDDRGLNFVGKTHYITVSALEENTDYEIIAETIYVTAEKGYAKRKIKTGPGLLRAGSIQPAGRILHSDGSPAEGAIVSVAISGPSGISAPLSTLVDSNGYWYVELINIRTAGNEALYTYSPDIDRLHVSAVSESGDTADLEGPVFDNQGGRNLYSDMIIR